MEPASNYPYPSQEKITKFIKNHPTFYYTLMICEKRHFFSGTSTNWTAFAKGQKGEVDKILYTCDYEFQNAIGLPNPKKNSAVEMKIEVDLITYCRICVEDAINVYNLDKFLTNLINSMADDNNPRKAYARLSLNCMVLDAYESEQYELFDKAISKKKLKINEMQQIKEDIMYMKSLLMTFKQGILNSFEKDVTHKTLAISQKGLASHIDKDRDMDYCFAVKYEDKSSTKYSIFKKGYSEDQIINRKLLNHCDRRLQNAIGLKNIEYILYDGIFTFELDLATMLKIKSQDKSVIEEHKKALINYILTTEKRSDNLSYIMLSLNCMAPIYSDDIHECDRYQINQTLLHKIMNDEKLTLDEIKQRDVEIRDMANELSTFIIEYQID